MAAMRDLPRLKAMYQKIIDTMNKNNIAIWDDIYPCDFFQSDIEKNRLFIATKGDDIVAAFALCASNDGAGALSWKAPTEKAMYVDRFGVNVNYLRQGVGEWMLKKAMKLAAEKNAAYLRLFVVDRNLPAINLYLKAGLQRVDGIYEQKFDDIVLREYGFEIALQTNSAS